MIRSLSLLLGWTLALALTGCGSTPSSAPPAAETPEAIPPAIEAPEMAPEVPQESDQAPETPAEPEAAVLTVTVGDRAFTATLADTQAAAEFASRLPLTMGMSELNGNEKYGYLDTALTTTAYAPGTIRAGALMLYGEDCVVLFYETFQSGYSYTPLAVLDDPAGLAEAVGSGGVTVTFAMEP